MWPAYNRNICCAVRVLHITKNNGMLTTKTKELSPQHGLFILNIAVRVTFESLNVCRGTNFAIRHRRSAHLSKTAYTRLTRSMSGNSLLVNLTSCIKCLVHPPIHSTLCNTAAEQESLYKQRNITKFRYICATSAWITKRTVARGEFPSQQGTKSDDTSMGVPQHSNAKVCSILIDCETMA
jgi:hypothetical protein